MRDRPRGISDAVVDDQALGAALREQQDREAGDAEIIWAEPLLSDFVRGELLKIYGKLGLSGAHPNVLRGLAGDLNHLVGVTAGAMRHGYQTLLDEFLPEDAPGAKQEDDPPAPPSPGQDDRNISNDDGDEVDVPF